MWRYSLENRKLTKSEFGVFRSLNATGASLRPFDRLKRWAQTRGASRTSLMFGEEVLHCVTRLVKMTVSQNRLTSRRFPIRLLRSGVATCLYHSGVDLEYIRRFGRWKPAAFAIYSHFDDKILRNLSPRMVNFDGLTSQLRVRTDAGRKVVFDQGRDMIRIVAKTLGGDIRVGQPAVYRPITRAGGKSSDGPTKTRNKPKQGKPPPPLNEENVD